MSFSKWLRTLLRRDAPVDPDTLPYPYPELLPVLQIACTPPEYAERRAGADDDELLRKHPESHPDYWAILPRYTYAECPLCHTRYSGLADTYHLNGWRTDRWLYKTLFVRGVDDDDTYCSHFMGIELFLNLHGHRPAPTDRLSVENGEVPYMTRDFFRHGVPTYAVLHALPICRTEGDNFVAGYTIFLLTYFSADVLELKTRINEKNARLRLEDVYHPFTPEYPGGSSADGWGWRAYELDEWVGRGHLGWLDFTQPDLPLLMGPQTALPPVYQRIKGRRKPYTWSSQYAR